MNLSVRKLGRRWWIVGDEDHGPIGPYGTRAEAEDDRRGLERFHRDESDITTDRRTNDADDIG